MTIPGIGPLAATALLAAIGDGTPRITRCSVAEAALGRPTLVFRAGDRSNGGRFWAPWAV
jgi:hypothetical protein